MHCTKRVNSYIFIFTNQEKDLLTIEVEPNKCCKIHLKSSNFISKYGFDLDNWNFLPSS